jgi:diaminopimelate epimerase
LFLLLDVDECLSSLANNCPANSNCTNNDGSYTCTCFNGFSKVGSLLLYLTSTQVSSINIIIHPKNAELRLHKKTVSLQRIRTTYRLFHREKVKLSLAYCSHLFHKEKVKLSLAHCSHLFHKEKVNLSLAYFVFD